MTLQPGFRLVVAPHFHLDADWDGRLTLGTGTVAMPDGPVARLPWRAVTTEDLAALVPTGPVERETLPACLALFVVPAHLRSTFWALLEQSSEHGTISPEALDAFVTEVARFLAFKQMPLPGGTAFEVVMNREGVTTPLVTSSLWGVINFGEGPSSLVFLNVAEPPDASYPPVKLRLAPGEGTRLPAGIRIGFDGRDRDQPDVVLVIRLPSI